MDKIPKYGYLIYRMKYIRQNYIGVVPIRKKQILHQYEKWTDVKQSNQIKCKLLYDLFIQEAFDNCKVLLNKQLQGGMKQELYKNFLYDCCTFIPLELVNNQSYKKQSIKKWIRFYSSITDGYNLPQDNDYEPDMEKEDGEYFVYKHTSPSGKSYIGITNNPYKRWETQGKKYKKQPKFYNAIKKYGWDNFSHEILESNVSKAYAWNREQYYIKFYDSINNGYNVLSGGKDTEHLQDGYEDKMVEKMIGEILRGY